METIKIGVGIVVASFILLLTCDEFSTATSKDTKSSESSLNELAISAYADSLDLLTRQASTQKSLIYQNNTYSFQILKYALKGKPFLYVEKGRNESGSEYEKKYYLKNEKLALYVENGRKVAPERPFIATKAYFRDNDLFYAEQKSSLTEEGLQDVKFHETDLLDNDYYTDLSTMEDALNQRGEFDLVFEGIADCPKAKYIILTKRGYNAYRAPIRVNNEDEFTHELSTNAYEHRGDKLDINWKISDTNEVIYQSGKIN